MMDTLQIVDAVVSHLIGSPLKIAITGDIYPDRRPPNSDMEDVVVNSLPVNAEQLQKGIVNVNIHVPDASIHFNEMDDTVPDRTRLKQLATIALANLKDIWIGTYHFDVQQQTLLQDEEAGDHYINIRLEFFNENL
jgi:hypothetical protein